MNTYLREHRYIVYFPGHSLSRQISFLIPLLVVKQSNVSCSLLRVRIPVPHVLLQRLHSSQSPYSHSGVISILSQSNIYKPLCLMVVIRIFKYLIDLYPIIIISLVPYFFSQLHFWPGMFGSLVSSLQR